MTAIMYNFDSGDGYSQQFTMGKACANPSFNPAMHTQSCIYIINNTNVNPMTAYIGYALNASHRWNTRTEVFHDFGISHAYGKNVKCAWCYPQVSKNNVNNPQPNVANHWEYVDDADMAGAHSAEHLLIRCILNGVMGAQVTVTNTNLRNLPFSKPQNWPGLSRVYIYFGNKFNWPNGNGRYVDV